MKTNARVRITEDESYIWFEIHNIDPNNRSGSLILEYDRNQKTMVVSCYKGCSFDLTLDQVNELIGYVKQIEG